MNTCFYFPSEISDLFSFKISIFYSMVSKTAKYISFNSYIKNYDINICISKTVDFDEFIVDVSTIGFHGLLTNKPPTEVP
jgi:hypothetical protein